MPSQQWLKVWTSIRISDGEGLISLRELVAATEYGVNGAEELIVGTMTGNGETTLMHQAGFYGRENCVDFMLDNGCRRNLREKSATGQNASEYAKFNEVDMYDPKNPEAPPTRPHNKVYHRLRLEMGEYVEQDMAENTPGLSTWNIKRTWPYKIPHEWQPDRPYHVLRDRAHPRKRRPEDS